MKNIPIKKQPHVQNSKNILFVNTGKIGDVMVSSIILENDNLLASEYNIWLLIHQSYKTLLEQYKGPIKVIFINHKKYRVSFRYRTQFLSTLRSIGFNECYNVSPARGMLTDEISLLAGAHFTYATCSDLTYLGTKIGLIMNKLYSKLLYGDVKNEYEKHIYILKKLTGEKNISYNNNRVFPPEIKNFRVYPKDKYILVSPLSTDKRRNWSIYNYRQLCNLLSERYLVVVTGNKREFWDLELIATGNKNIIVDISNLSDVVRLIANTFLYIGGDSGLTHIALKFGVPTLSILDGGFWGMYFPFYPDKTQVIYLYHSMDCFGCKLNCIYSEERCLSTISVQEVYSAVCKMLAVLE
ncbi:MAG: glycosyltransferase family 9 protein [Ignavibacteria bacterium]